MIKSRKLPESVIIFGCGYLGTALAKHLLNQGVKVGALTRNAEKAADLRKIGAELRTSYDQAAIEVIEGDLDLDDWHERVERRYESVVNCVSSAGGGLAGYQKSYVDGQRSILEWAKSQSIRSYVYTSSTSVYPQDDGLLIDESADIDEAITGAMQMKPSGLPWP